MNERVENTPVPLPAEREAAKVERNFTVLPTHIPDFYLLVDHGTAPDLRRSETIELCEKSVIYGITADKLKALTKAQEETREALLALQQEYPGLRGARDLREGIEVQFNPQTKSVFNEALLDESLGERSNEFMHKKVEITLELDPTTEDVDAITKSIKRVLRRRGYTKDQIDEKVKVVRAGVVFTHTGVPITTKS